MGCDIHLFTEMRDTPDSPWRSVKVTHACSCGGTTAGCYWCKGTGRRVYHDRNYSLFGQLADVRNYNGYEPVAEPRGLPDDLSPELRALFDERHGLDYDTVEEQYGSVPGDHTPSHLSVRELVEYRDKHASSDMVWNGVVSWEEFKKLRERKYVGFPECWCAATSARTITQEEAEQLEDGTRPAVLVSWRTGYLEGCMSFWGEYLDELSKVGGPDNVRIVFNFDS